MRCPLPRHRVPRRALRPAFRARLRLRGARHHCRARARTERRTLRCPLRARDVRRPVHDPRRGTVRRVERWCLGALRCVGRGADGSVRRTRVGYKGVAHHWFPLLVHRCRDLLMHSLTDAPDGVLLETFMLPVSSMLPPICPYALFICFYLS